MISTAVWLHQWVPPGTAWQRLGGCAGECTTWVVVHTSVCICYSQAVVLVQHEVAMQAIWQERPLAPRVWWFGHTVSGSPGSDTLPQPK